MKPLHNCLTDRKPASASTSPGCCAVEPGHRHPSVDPLQLALFWAAERLETVAGTCFFSGCSLADRPWSRSGNGKNSNDFFGRSVEEFWDSPSFWGQFWDSRVGAGYHLR
jgi:hypothetical protein